MASNDAEALMRYLIDSNIWIYAMNGRHPLVREKLESLALSDVFLSDFVFGELAFGWENSQKPDATRKAVEQFIANFPQMSTDVTTAKRYGQIRHVLKSKGTPIGMNDMWIAAQAITHKMTLVTHNTREFSRVEGLKLEDWVTL